jgi:hypothetical protein
MADGRSGPVAQLLTLLTLVQRIRRPRHHTPVGIIQLFDSPTSANGKLVAGEADHAVDARRRQLRRQPEPAGASPPPAQSKARSRVVYSNSPRVASRITSAPAAGGTAREINKAENMNPGRITTPRRVAACPTLMATPRTLSLSLNVERGSGGIGIDLDGQRHRAGKALERISHGRQSPFPSAASLLLSACRVVESAASAIEMSVGRHSRMVCEPRPPTRST